MSKVLAPKGRGGRMLAIYELPGRQRRTLRLLVCRCPFDVNSQQSRAACLMQDYNLWADLLATFRASPDAIKALWLLVPPMFVLGVLGLAIWTLRLRIKLTSPTPPARQGRQPALVLDHADFEALTQAQGREPQMLAVPPARLSSFGDPS